MDSVTKLEIRYPSFRWNTISFEDGLDAWNELLDEYNPYSSCESLVIETDFICDLPSNVKKFTKLKELSVEGARFWDMNPNNLPDTIEHIVLADLTNLNLSFLDPFKTVLPRLQTFIIADHLIKVNFTDAEWGLEPDYKVDHVLPFIPSLRCINVVGCRIPGSCDTPTYLEYIKKHPFFASYAEIITSLDHAPRGPQQTVASIRLH
jgi:hypothetical protein